MELTMTISVAVIAAILVVAVIFTIPVLLQIRRAVQQVEKLAETARMQIAPLSHDITAVSKTATEILHSVYRQVDKVEESVMDLRDGAGRLRDFEEEIIHRIEGPILTTSALLGAISQGVSTFFRVLRR
jgi:uncharacterized protein YoxC